jgi:hypothetical protein
MPYFMPQLIYFSGFSKAILAAHELLLLAWVNLSITLAPYLFLLIDSSMSYHVGCILSILYIADILLVRSHFIPI